MNAFPDFSTHGYQVIRELGYNSLGGRVTYLATKINTKKSVVIKQFQFAQLDSSWTEYEAYEQEIKVLQKLDRPGIPRYLDSFQTDSGFCMVQEYKNAESVANRSFAPPDIKQIAIATLEILAYLQSQKPPLIHRDIKPENLLIDAGLNVYLVDFGFARVGGGNIAASSVVKGTMGFMPPEQMFNRQLTEASDLYGLGATLICLLTGTKSVDVGNLIDANYSIHFRHLVPPLQQGWMNWLETMVAPRIQDRYKSAANALTTLKSLDVSRLPKVRIERDRLQFTATEFAEKVTKTVTISNPIPDTILAGRWEVAPHPNDPPHTPYDHSWISFEPQSFESNELECQIAVDTSKLLASQTYQRQIILHANSDPECHKIAIEVKTAPLPEAIPMPYFSLNRRMFMFLFICLGWLFSIYPGISSLLLAPLLTGFIAAEQTLAAEVKGTNIHRLGAIFGANLGVAIMLIGADRFCRIILGSDYNGVPGIFYMALLIGCVVSALVGASAGSLANINGLNIWVFAASIVLIIALLNILDLGYMAGLITILGMGLIIVCWLSSMCALGVETLVNGMVSVRLETGVSEQDAVTIGFLTAGFCINLGAGFLLFLKFAKNLDSVEPWEILLIGGITLASFAATAIPLVNLIVFKRNRIIADYRKYEPNLIKPEQTVLFKD
ncbi:protein kinase [Microcoleus sp. herbarium14]|uniref:serine/threonine protein kinase n=1 Tax=Microcoleus sp. herbarium14 TaxID=3055439 RepID=UPI002FD3A547